MVFVFIFLTITILKPFAWGFSDIDNLYVTLYRSDVS